MMANPYYSVGDEAEELRAEVERLREALREAIKLARDFNRGAMTWKEYDRKLAALHRLASDDDGERCPKCGKPSASPPAEVYCVECATEGWEQDAEAWRVHRARVASDDRGR